MTYFRLLRRLLTIKSWINEVRAEGVVHISEIFKKVQTQFIWKQSHIFYILLASFLILFLRAHVIKLYDDFFVDKFLARIYKESTNIELMLVLALFVCLVYWCYQSLVKTKYKISLFTLYIPVVACYWYSCERISMKKYILAPLFSKPFKLYYTDLVFGLLALAILILLWNIFKVTFMNKIQGILQQDVPLADFGQDEFNRAAYVKRLVSELHSIDLMHAKSFTIGVNSSWGTGKTSVLGAFKDGIGKTDNKICIEYNPWLSSHKESLTYDFFVHLESKISDYLETSNIVIEYGAKLAEAEHEVNSFKAVSHLLKKEISLKESFDKISQLILSLHRKLYVIIDDLDRLDNSEVMKILQLVRNTANFPNIIFIVAYDKDYLINALKVNNIFSPEKYLEKIFDLEIVLPVIEDIKIRESLRKTVLDGLSTTTLTVHEKQVFEDQIYKLIFSNTAGFNSTKSEITSNNLLSIIKNKRDIIKFSNSFLLSLKLNKKLVYLPDLFILELIKYASSPVYSRLAANDRYLDVHSEDNVRTYQLHPSANAEDNLFRGSLFNIKDEILDPAVQNLVSALFSTSDNYDYQRDRAITIADNFYSYFLFAVPATSVDPEILDDLIFS